MSPNVPEDKESRGKLRSGDRNYQQIMVLGSGRHHYNGVMSALMDAALNTGRTVVLPTCELEPVADPEPVAPVVWSEADHTMLKQQAQRVRVAAARELAVAGQRGRRHAPRIQSAAEKVGADAERPRPTKICRHTFGLAGGFTRCPSCGKGAVKAEP